MSTLQTSSGSRAEPTVNVVGVSKWFGNVVAVNDVSFDIYPGVTGLLGPNGAGKTTLLHMITGLSKVSKGEVSLLGERPRDNVELYRRVGIMGEHEGVYGFFTGRQFVEFSGRLYGLQPLKEYVDKAIARVGLEEAQHRVLSTYSRGMRQRMRLAATMVHDPQVLILDEPLNGTDPRQRLEFQDLMKDLAGEGRTIVISSHILEEVEIFAKQILLMVSGKLAASGDYRAIRAKLDERPYRVRVVVSEPRKMAAAILQMEEADSVSVDGEGVLTVLSQKVSVLQRSLPRLAKELGVRLLRVEPLDDSLESVFSYVVER